MVRFFIRNKKGDLELDEIGKLILGGLLLLILIYIIGYVISGEFSNQGDKVDDVFSIFK